jgi:hypothetical protein
MHTEREGGARAHTHAHTRAHRHTVPMQTQTYTCTVAATVTVTRGIIMAAPLQAVWLGGTAYGPALALQRRLVDARHTDHNNSSSSDSKGAGPSVGLGRVWDTDVVLGVVHPPTYTVGRRLVGDVAEAARLRALGADYYEVRVPVPVPVPVCLCLRLCLCACACVGAS